MSPIDIVPVAPQAHEETFFDTTQVDVGFVNPAFSLTERSGITPRRANGHVKHVRFDFCMPFSWMHMRLSALLLCTIEPIPLVPCTVVLTIYCAHK